MLLQLALLGERRADLVAAVLAGRLSPRDVLDLDEGTCSCEAAALESLYAICHDRLVQRVARLGRNVPPITDPCPSLNALELELAHMPLVADTFLAGGLTLVQARYAHRMALDSAALAIFVDRCRRKRVVVISAPPSLQPVSDHERDRLYTLLEGAEGGPWYAARLREANASRAVVHTCVVSLGLDATLASA